MAAVTDAPLLALPMVLLVSLLSLGSTWLTTFSLSMLYNTAPLLRFIAASTASTPLLAWLTGGLLG